ncbi:DUF3617 domain-containing protein [Sphingomicrobium sediminis]|uniref:DUF3617 domain-containing protein n=1 Tax=Sphingomicrobium sediminis TaxID=2950949 RepID=A0A9X2J506_9SPHN|nr:DUF3617 domain-containing protein [Sphingomicrobium sediminis]MCM8557757.1 DUF3617 domain-containing protein [Sphingomicrobium sediminis]
MKRMILVTAGCAMLMACGSSGDAGDSADTDSAATAEAESDSVLDVLAEGDKPQAGRWEVETEIIEAQIPGVPENMRDMVVNSMGMNNSFAYCMTPEQAEQDPDQVWKESNGDCEFESFERNGGQVEAVAVCNSGGAEMRMTMSGTQGRNSYSARNEMEMSTPEGDGKLVVEVEGRRTGDCDGTEVG